MRKHDKYELLYQVPNFYDYWVTSCNNLFYLKREKIIKRNLIFGDYTWTINTGGVAVRLVGSQIGVQITKEHFVESAKLFPEKFGIKPSGFGNSLGYAVLCNEYDNVCDMKYFSDMKKKKRAIEYLFSQAKNLKGRYYIKFSLQ
jgi:hypothetical protein